MGLDRIGTFRGKPLDWGIGAKKTGDKFESPNFQIKILLTQFYDQKENEWFDYSENEEGEAREAEITTFLYLVGKIKAKGGAIGTTLNMEQVKKVFGWDGRSVAQLVNGNYSELEFQVRIKDNDPEYADRNPYQVSWIDVYDASPSSLRKLDAVELKALDKQFATIFAKTATSKPVVTAAKAPAKAHPARVPADDAVPPTAAEKARKMAEKSAKNKKAAAVAKARKIEARAGDAAEEAAWATPPPKPESEDAVVPPAKPDTTACTMNEAWNTIVELRDPSISDKVIGKVWHDAIAEIAGPDVELENITLEQWCQIKDKTLESVAKF